MKLPKTFRRENLEKKTKQLLKEANIPREKLIPEAKILKICLQAYDIAIRWGYRTRLSDTHPHFEYDFTSRKSGIIALDDEGRRIAIKSIVKKCPYENNIIYLDISIRFEDEEVLKLDKDRVINNVITYKSGYWEEFLEEIYKKL